MSRIEFETCEDNKLKVVFKEAVDALENFNRVRIEPMIDAVARAIGIDPKDLEGSAPTAKSWTNFGEPLLKPLEDQSDTSIGTLGGT
jgi:hypothetical protein